MNKYLIVIFMFSLISFSSSAGVFSGFKSTLNDESVESYPFSDDSPPTIIVFSSIIDWNEQKVKVSAKTKININSESDGGNIKDTYTVLKTLALKKAVETIDTINIDSVNTFKTMKSNSTDFSRKLQTFVTDITVYDLDKSYKDTGILMCTLSIPIAGTSSLTGFVSDYYIPHYFNFKIPEIPFLSYKLYAEEATGIIIDARDLKINPALLPKIKTDKKDLYNPKNVSKKTLSENGAVQYAVVGTKVDENTIKKEAGKQEISALKRTGSNPIIIKAYKSSGTLQTDAIISEKDAKLVENSKALKEGKVTIIVDSRVGGIIGKNIGENEILVLSLGDLK